MDFTKLLRKNCLNLLCLFLLGGFWLPVFAQRSYKPASVLAAGTWYKISVPAEGVYKADASFLASLGITAPIPSGQLRFFAGSNGMLPEAAGENRIDDLEELAIAVEDGGDGQLNGTDYFLFYADGPHKWKKDTANRRFSYQKNLYSEKAFYFITIGGNGKRVATQAGSPVASVSTATFDERYTHEKDSVNFLSSGKEWWGEEFSALPGRLLSRTFALPLTGLVAGPATLATAVAARSVGTGSAFSVSLNGVPVQEIAIPAIGTGLYENFAREAVQTSATGLNQPTATVALTYAPGSMNSQAWLNWLAFFCRRSLVLPAGGQLSFRDWATVGQPAVQFNLSVPDAATQVWDVTDPFWPVKMNATTANNTLQFSNEAQRLHEYIAFSTAFPLPTAEGRVANQNLHATTEADYLVVTAPAFLPQAQRLASFHRQREQLLPVVATTEQIYNEFSGGIPDPAAIRDFAKMYFDRYRSNWTAKGRYLLLFGKGSFDYKNRVRDNTNRVPAYESAASLNPLDSYTSDDFFGFLEDAEDINNAAVTNTLDLGIGRVPAQSADEANAFVEKVLAYYTAASLGPWRNNLNLVADDEDQNLHLNDAEVLAATAAEAPVFNVQKIYLDAFQQESGSAGGRYPAANAAINSQIYAGTLIWNYVGHGGPQRLAEEVVLDASIISSWNNPYRLPLLITATCDFATYDNPYTTSLGEDLLIRPRTGAIALMTTSRVVFANSNRIINANYLKTALQPGAAGRYKTLGEAVQETKNLTYTTSGDLINNRKFVLLGDPALTLAFPTLRVQATALNGRPLATHTDTLGATAMAVLEGEVQDNSGALQTGFNGTVYLTLFDKERSVTTLGNDAGSLPVAFSTQEAVLFKGKATATAGRFSFRFRLPKDINFQYGAGKISLYAEDGKIDGNGSSKNVVIGGMAAGSPTDNEGPVIKAWLNDERFVNGSLTNEAPVLLVALSDSSGINTGGAGIGHDLVATLDNDNSRYFVLNNFFEADVNNYQQGRLRFPLPPLSPGAHTLTIKAWDVLNNPGETRLDFIVAHNDGLQLSQVLNYPNPFSTQTAFWFEHNYPGEDLHVKVEVFTVSGKVLKTITRTINTPGNRSIELNWDGRDEWGDKVGRGIYLYRLRVAAANGKTAVRWGKMAVL